MQNSEIKTVVVSEKRNETVKSVFTDGEAYLACKALKSKFATSLVEQLDRRGFLSSEQNFWLHKLAMQSVETTAPASSVKMENLRRIFDRASKKMKYPKVKFQASNSLEQAIHSFDDDCENQLLADQTIFLYRAGERSKAPGVIHVTNGAKYGDPDNKYFGKIDLEGNFIKARACCDRVLNFLVSFDKDPASIGATYGRSSGNCCFCSRPITTEVSKNHGYGPICANRYQLPYDGGSNQNYESDDLDTVIENMKKMTPDQLNEWITNYSK